MKTLWINWYTKEIWRKMEADENDKQGKTQIAVCADLLWGTAD